MKPLLAKQIPLKELGEIAEQLLEHAPADEVIDQIAALADALVNWNDVLTKVFPGMVGALAGAAAELADGPLAKAIAKAVVKAAQKRRGK